MQGLSKFLFHTLILSVLLAIGIKWFLNDDFKARGNHDEISGHYHMFFPPKSKQLQNFCVNSSQISEFQMNQYHAARQDMRSPLHNNHTFNPTFYLRHFGGFAVDVIDCLAREVTSIRYYTIWKNGKVICFYFPKALLICC